MINKNICAADVSQVSCITEDCFSAHYLRMAASSVGMSFISIYVYPTAVLEGRDCCLLQALESSRGRRF